MAAELISFGTGANWISQLWRQLKKIRKYRNEELEKINLIIFGDPVEIARYYVEPDCQEGNFKYRIMEAYGCRTVFKGASR